MRRIAFQHARAAIRVEEKLVIERGGFRPRHARNQALAPAAVAGNLMVNDFPR